MASKVHSRKVRERGATLPEFAILLGFVALLAGAIHSFANNVSTHLSDQIVAFNSEGGGSASITSGGLDDPCKGLGEFKGYKPGGEPICVLKFTTGAPPTSGTP